MIKDYTKKEIKKLIGACEIEYPYGTDSCDPSMKLRCPDGREIHVGNYLGADYDFFAYEVISKD